MSTTQATTTEAPQVSGNHFASRDAVLTDPGMTDQARVLGDWVAARGRNLTDIFVTHGHGDHWITEQERTARV
jgi:glyoxylase-like metal-dependent hydrolase (beta-lactamase superfamily II)